MMMRDICVMMRDICVIPIISFEPREEDAMLRQERLVRRMRRIEGCDSWNVRRAEGLELEHR